MVIIKTVNDKYFTLDGVQFAKIYQPLAQGSEAIGIYNVFDTKQQLKNSTNFNEYSINGVIYTSQAATMSALLAVIYSVISVAEFEDLENRVDNLEASQPVGYQVYSNYNDEGDGRTFLPTTGTLLVSYKVADDPDTTLVDPPNTNNGFYHWGGSVYIKDSSIHATVLDPLDTNEAVTGKAVADYSLKKDDLGYVGVNVIDEAAFTDGYELNADNLTPYNNIDMRVSDYMPVYGYAVISCDLWKSGDPAASSVVVGYEDKYDTSPLILFSANELSGSGKITVYQEKITIPENIKYVRFTDRYSSRWTIETVNSPRQYPLVVGDSEIETLLMGRAAELNHGNYTSPTPVSDSELSPFMKVESGEDYIINTCLWYSSAINSSTYIIGYSDTAWGNPTIIYDARNTSLPMDSYVRLYDAVIKIPVGVNYVRFSNKIDSKIKPTFYREKKEAKTINRINSGNDFIPDLRGEMIINRARFASQLGLTGEHDSHILVNEVQGVLSAMVLYRATDNYYLSIISLIDEKVTSSTAIVAGGAVGWAPRMYKKDSDTVRIMYTKSKTDVHYKDYTLSTAALGVETTFKVAIKTGGVHDTPIAFTLDRFLQHVFNVSGIDYRDPAYDDFAIRSLLVEDTQQVQTDGSGRYYITSEVLADSMPSGDTGGIACLMYSDDLDTWYLNDPVSVNTDLDEQRDHEISATYLNGIWHALTRSNKGGLNIGAPAGYKHYTSTDGNNWTDEGLLDLPNAFNGIRHACVRLDLKYSQGHVTDSNKYAKTAVFILYQRIPKTQGIKEMDDTTHKLRTEIGLVYTLDYINFIEVATITDRANIAYPSMAVYMDRMYMSWSSGFIGQYFNSGIMWSTYNIGKL